MSEREEDDGLDFAGAVGKRLNQINKDFESVVEGKKTPDGLSNMHERTSLAKPPVPPVRQDSPTPKDSKVLVKGSLSITLGEIEDVFSYIKGVTQPHGTTLEKAFDLMWHKISPSDREGLLAANMALTLWRMRKDGNLNPPINLNEIYLDAEIKNEIHINQDLAEEFGPKRPGMGDPKPRG